MAFQSDAFQINAFQQTVGGGGTTGHHYYRLLARQANQMTIFLLSESTAARRRFPVYLVDATDGITAETGEASGQPQISKNGAAFANTTATLTAVGNGSYYVELTAVELDTLGGVIVRYKSANTAEFSMSGRVLAFDVFGTEVTAIKAKTDALPADPADASDIATRFTTLDAALAVVDDFLDTEVAAIKAKTDNLPADPAGLAALAAAHGAGSWLSGGGGGGDATLANQAAMLALLHCNAVLDNEVYSDGFMTSARLRGFADATAAGAAVLGAADGASSETTRFAITATKNVDGTLASYRMVRQL